MGEKIRRIKEKEPLVSEILSNLLSIDVKQPFLDPRVIDFASKIPFHLKVHKPDGEGEVIGKWILRKAFENLLPGEIIWKKGRYGYITWDRQIIPDCFFKNAR